MTNKKTQKVNNYFVTATAVVVLACLMFFSVVITYAWFESTQQKQSNPTVIEPFKIDVNIWFDNNKNDACDVGEKLSEITVNTGSTASPNMTSIGVAEYFKVNLQDATSPNYFTKLRVDATYSGVEEAAMRIRVSLLWTDIEGNATIIPSHGNVKYATDKTKFIDNTSADSCYYFCRTSVSPITNSSYILSPADKVNNIYPTYNVIKSVTDPVRYPLSISLALSIKGELAQSNRIQQLWGTLPAAPAKP